ncbi:MAG: peptidase M28, partial [Pedobacter sp.]
MKKLFTLFLFCSLAISLKAQTLVNRNPDIEKMVQAVNPDSLKSYISKMVAFGTRSTISDTKSKTKGIGAARNWVVSKFNQFAKQGNGRMTAFLDTVTIKADGKRVDQQIVLGNAVAILKGTDGEDKRVFVVSGHLDSRVTDVMN